MRFFIISMYIILPIFMLPLSNAEAMNDDEISIIVEVTGDPEKQKQHIEKDYPFVTVVEVYDTLFNGLALKGFPRDLAKVVKLDFIQATHSVQYYQSVNTIGHQKKEIAGVSPADFNQTSYTGKGVKVGVIDTGIDENHPDLTKNYAGGYDLVDFDEDPHETLPEEGLPTMHGTHVAGIIAANGQTKGVATNAELHAYRALGPGGIGSSIQVIAAMERAVKDGVDVINLSLGNTVNGADYPTSNAVNKASELGVAVVIASGNAGPDAWTVGAPGTAKDALVVGAAHLPEKQAFLRMNLNDKSLPLQQLQGSPSWDLTKDYQVTNRCESREDVAGKIVMLDESTVQPESWLKECEENDAVAIILSEAAAINVQAEQGIPSETSIPISLIASKNEKYLKEEIQANTFLQTVYQTTDLALAVFSSRGPVTGSWELKPDVLAPGVNIISTIPGGYTALNGTSMAAPHVAGAVAVVKEAHPNWSNKQVIGALKTTAKTVTSSERILKGTKQGMGEVDIAAAIQAETILHDPQLTFGHVENFMKKKEHSVTIENVTNETQTYTFDIPHKKKGITWELPQSFEVEPKEKKKVMIKATINPIELESGMHEGRIHLLKEDEQFSLPYLFINETADYPKTMGFDFSLQPFTEEMYKYQFYASESLESMEVNLYNADTFIYDRTLLHLTDIPEGLNEGERKATEVGAPGVYIAFITIQLKSGEFKTIQQRVMIE